MAEPRVQYAKTSDGLDIAYHVIGEGPPLVQTIDPMLGHLSAAWQISWIRSFSQQLAGSFQVVRFDPRGAGLSQREPLNFSLDARLLDVEAVAGKLGLDRFAVFGSGHGTPVAIAFAARYPERVTHLILQRVYAQGSRYAEENAAARFTGSLSDQMIEEQWTFAARALASRRAPEPAQLDELAGVIQAAMTPQAFLAFRKAVRSIDVSGLLPNIAAPSLVLQDGEVRAGEFSREVAAAIPNARLAVTGPNAPAAPVISEFVLGGASGRTAIPPSSGLVTILFTDLASSTALTQRLGDAQAQELVRAHNAIVREALVGHGGSEIKHTGDGIMASFPTASGAIKCAAAIQRGVAARDDADLQVRVGLNAGEPVAEESDLFGTAVQLARRICDQAAAGEILVSNVVRELAAGKNFLFADRGDIALRGFEDPVRIYELRWRDEV